MTYRISGFQDERSLSNYITIFFAEGIWKVHIFRHLFVCFQISVLKLGEFHKNRNNSTVFEELPVSIVDLTVANICFNWLRFASPLKRHLRPLKPQLTPPILQIQYCYSWSIGLILFAIQANAILKSTFKSVMEHQFVRKCFGFPSFGMHLINPWHWPAENLPLLVQ